MKIYGKPIQRIHQIYQELSKTKKTDKTPSSGKAKDKVVLSNEALEIQAIVQKVKETEDISPKAVEIKKAISSGTYTVSGEKVASSLIKFLK
ncbi:MAG: flagellar biosynthesis anti-sigma factor FlgM [Firmicutes bacterium]|nr:flagellar biosynthesis anti-sigma factor FlgM [Bacillota bacterium]